ncbi:MAG: hypothetical protein CVU79_10190 [Elusimicrobia bacterium HGW-Elusimicrobia-3]|jgi:hypothetical protein|nr:MAG: hypothetical protein CVU79_10190 [Elusimicrobia bacterium HGW-Elusimicrobia-3]
MTQNIPEKLLKTRPQDYVLSGALLLASLFWLTAPSGAGGAAPSTAVLSAGGRRLAELPLDRPARRTFSLAYGRLTVEVEPGKGVRILESNCPAKVCLHHGWASHTGETIACVPNELLVEVEGEESEYDAVIH